MRCVRKALFAAGILWLAAAGSALADPADVHLTSMADFEQAKIEPVLEWNEALEGLHPGQRDQFRPPQLFLVDELFDPQGTFEPDRHPGLVMAWGTPEDTGEIISAWELVLPEDPDLTAMCITLTAWPRQGMTSISFSLQDVFGVMKGWRWPVGFLPGELPPDTPSTVTVAAAGGPGQAGSTGFWDGGVDLTQIVSFEFDESGMAAGGLPLPSNLPGFVGQWNFWHDILVFRCPSQPPARPEHFSCYMVDERSRLSPGRVSLVDQFTAEHRVLVHKPREICTPVSKNGEEVRNKRDHLVCYDVFARERVNALVRVTNQFGEQKLRVKHRVMRLCVPSRKEVLER